MKNFNFKTLLLAIGLVVACVQTMDAGTRRIYFKDQTWWSKDGAASAVHYWGGSATGTTWPGARMTKVSGTSNIWYYDIPDNVGNFCFVRVSGSGTIADWGAKTGDLSFNSTNNLYTLSTTEAWDEKTAGGSWSKYAPNGAIVGSMNSWDPTTNQFSSGSVTITLEANKTYAFKVLYGSDYYGNNSAITSSISNWSFATNTSEDCHLTTAVAGSYTFTWNNSTKKLSVTYPAITHPSADYYYVKNVANWSQVNAHLFTESGIDTWPGFLPSSTTIGGDTYYYFAAGAETKVRFSNNGSNQTSDLTLSGNKGSKYYNNSTNTWEKFQTTVTIDKNGGETDGSTTVTLGNKTCTVTQPTRTGYTNKGYYKESGCTNYIMTAGGSLQKSTDFTDSDGKWTYGGSTLTLYTQWQATEYKVTLDQTDATTEATRKQPTVTYDATLPAINAANKPSRDYYNFAGYWTSNGKTSGEWGSMLISDAPAWQEVTGYTATVNSNLVWKRAEDVTVYPKWTPIVYSYTFEQNGGSGATDGTYTYESNAITLPTASEMSKTGYTFEGWYTEAVFTNRVTQIPAQSNGNKKFFAKWTPIVTTVTVNMNGGDNENQEMEETFDTEFDISSLDQSKFTRTGYDFKGLYTAQTGGSYLVNENWVKRSSSAVTGWLNGSANAKWVNPNTTATIYAQWTAHQWTITLNDNGGTGGSGSKTAKYGTTDGITSVAKPTRDNHTFAGYEDSEQVLVYNADGNLLANAGSYTDADRNWIYDNNITLYAKWNSAGNYVITLDNLSATTAGTTSVNVQINTTTGLTTNITCPEKTGYTFGGYFTDSQGKGTQLINADGSWIKPATDYIDGDGKWIFAGNVTLKAKWDANKTIVSLDQQSGTGGTTQRTLDYNSTQNLENINLPTREGYTFGGYFTETNGGGTQLITNEGAWIPNVSGYTGEMSNEKPKWIKTSTDPLTLYAKWTAITYTINYEGNGNTGGTTESSTHTYDAAKNLTANGYVRAYTVSYTYNGATGGNSEESAVANYTFANWTYNETNYSDEQPVTNLASTQDAVVTMTAQWISASVTLPTPVRTGYTFNGWYNNAERIGGAGDSYTPTADIALTAQWTEVKSTLTAGVNDIGTAAGYKVTGANAIGVVSTAILTASAAGTGYTFEGWTLTNCTRTSGAEKSTTITVKGTGNGEAATATANYAEDLNTGWRINLGYDGMEQWFTNDFVKKSGATTASVGYLELELQENYEYKFKVVKKSPETWYGNNGTMTQDNCTNWTFYEKVMGDAHIQCTAAGKYIFKVDYSGTDPVVSVTYPAAQTYTVTMAVDGLGTTTPATSVELNAFTGTEITATPTEHSGYHFKNWTGTDGITFADANAATTTAKATGTGTITAHFEKDTYIYFNNTIAQKWTKEPIYIYLYKGEGYWDNSMGTGAQDGGNYMGRFEMTKLPNTEIWLWHYDPLHGFQGDNKITYVAFSNSDMAGYQYFHNGQAVYKSYNDCMNMFVPDASQTPKQINNTDYYNDGFWRQYNEEHSKMYLHIWDVTGGKELDGAGYEMKTSAAGNEAFNATVKLENSHQYNIYFGSCDGKNYSRNTTINSDNCSGIQFFKYDKIDDKSQLAYLNTGSGGDYVFTLTYDNDKMTLSIEYPITTSDYRVKIGTPARYSNIIRATEASGTISMFLNAGTNILTYEEATDVNVDPIVWGNTKSINVNVTNAGVYTMTLAKGGTIEASSIQPYTGKYYVRTDCAQGGWNEYKTNDNNLMRYTDRQPDYEDNPATGFNYYYCRWNENAEGNVRFVIANEINPCISDTLKEDAILDDTEFLKGKANIRFSWNSNTNALNRAYISGSYDDAEYLQIRSVGNKLFKDQAGTEPILDARLDDNNDWTYIIDVYANGQAQAAVSAKYNNKYQFFVGTGNAETGEVTNRVQIIAQADKAHMQLVYDFKTDRIVTGWIPGDVITADITLQSDAILTRVHQGQLSPIKFSSDGISVLEVQTMYGVLQLDKDIMTDGHTQDADKIYERNIYWISFPFDVRVGDIFGVDGYGEKWVMQRYNGAKRAEIGWFAETATFWEYMDQNDIMEANVGYTLTLDPDYFDNASDAMWANGKTSVSFYFPSVTHNIDVVSNGQAKSSIPAHECKIDRTFGDGKNHMTTDANWNVIGIPTFQDLDNPDFAVPSVYKWDPATNTYSIQELKSFTLEASHAYFVQWGREDLVTWPNASIIKPKAPYKYADAKNYMVDLYFSYGDKEDHTYINLKDEAKADFVLNEDMMKVTNSGQPNIYSYAGAYDVAYNATAFENQTVNLGVIARKNGSYTFSMPKDFSGSAILVDLEEGTFTDLNVSNYSVDLNKGTYNNRFQLMLEVEAKIPTNIENANGGLWSEDGKTQKLLINDQIYLINAGRIYNATGTMVK